MTTEEKAKAYDNIIEKANKMHGENCEACQICIEELIPELAESEDEKIRKALIEMVHDTTGDSLWVDYNVHKEDAIAWLEKQGEQKPAEWSEEDNLQLQAAIDICKSSGHTITSDWLKSIKDKIQPKQEWSEEDSRILYNVKAYIGYAAGQSGVKDELFKEANEWLNSLPIGFIYSKNYNEDMVTLLVSELKQIANDNNVPEQYQMEINWLKSLRPQNKWKPSDEQIKALAAMLTISPQSPAMTSALMELYQNLKKLREE